MSLSFLRFGLGLITWRLAVEGYFLAKLPTFAKKFSFAKLYRVLPKGLELRQIVCKCCWNLSDIIESCQGVLVSGG